jgi:hypothetical protein
MRRCGRIDPLDEAPAALSHGGRDAAQDAVLWMLAGALLWISLAPVAVLAAERVLVRVETVLAREVESPGSKRVSATLEPQLQKLFRYQSYRSLGREHRSLGWGARARFEIPGGRHLVLVPRGAAPGGVSLRVNLVQGKEVLMNSDLILPRQGRVMVGGPAYQDGVLIIWLGARTAEAPGGRREDAAEAHMGGAPRGAE